MSDSIFILGLVVIFCSAFYLGYAWQVRRYSKRPPLGVVRKVKNKDRAFGAALEYNHVRVLNTHNEVENWLLTDHGMVAARQLADMNETDYAPAH